MATQKTARTAVQTQTRETREQSPEVELVTRMVTGEGLADSAPLMQKAGLTPEIRARLARLEQAALAAVAMRPAPALEPEVDLARRASIVARLRGMK